ncbi:Demethylmenaquinone methyltransferase [Purpureocillium lavendulum]|uniref:Demethylmenaquinone methyltransferase n=1 Tax=Purpureocillium lavendulum TaxID=1247861 RepID=A0AB34FXR0_9HYPO|nr:Demethylmenaquinone methyltransferase [Purpureocillium lavendulum]
MQATSRWPASPSVTAILAWLLLLSHQAAGEKVLSTNSLNTCQKNSGFSASFFKVIYSPENNTLDINMMATSTIQGKVLFDLTVWAYGFRITHQIIDPCNIPQTGLCPMTPGKFNHPFRISGDNMKGASETVPAVAYTVPDLDATVKVYVNLTSTGEPVACLEADISNGKTVSVAGVKWATATFIGLGLLCAAVAKKLGRDITAIRILANTLAIFQYFQSQAIIGLTAVHLPPIVQSWAQNFQWSMGIVRIGWMQRALTWYQRATAGRASRIFDSLGAVSVQVLRRGLAIGETGWTRTAKPDTASALAKRDNILNESGSYVVTGVQRVAFRAGIETTNLFMTGVAFFYFFALFVVLSIVLAKAACELGNRRNLVEHKRFAYFRSYWLDILKGTIVGICLIGFSQVVILCLWEFTQRDSPAEIVLAVGLLLSLSAVLALGTYKTIRVWRRTRTACSYDTASHGPFAGAGVFDKFGSMCIQYRPSAAYFVAPSLIHILGKAMFVALGQNKPIAQAIGLILFEVGFLIGASVIRPWMDKGANSFNIAICAVQFVDSILLFIFCNVFSIPTMVLGIVGVVFFALNAAFSLILMLIVITSAIAAFLRRGPDAEYHTMVDDRALFMKTQTHKDASVQLDDLSAYTRGDAAKDSGLAPTRAMANH